jgi:hypothetical protein
VDKGSETWDSTGKCPLYVAIQICKEKRAFNEREGLDSGGDVAPIILKCGISKKNRECCGEVGWSTAMPKSYREMR